MNNFDQIEAVIGETDIFQYGIISPAEITYHQEIRDICAANGCRQYAKTWACPPAVGTIEACKARCLQYDTMMLFSSKVALEDSFDFEAMREGMADFKRIAHDLEEKIAPFLRGYQILSNEGCGICAVCTYPHSPCRCPSKLHHAIEGYGIIVSEAAKKAGIAYNNGENTVTYFGALLFNNRKQNGMPRR